jgi:type IV pilus assembly protein PilV
MKTNIAFRSRQTGSFIIEGMISILIFSVGILGLMGLQAVSIKTVSDSKYRSDASFLADKLVSQMWVADMNTAAVQTSFQAGGAAYLSWCNNDVKSTQTGLPGVTGATGCTTGPNAPTVLFDANNNATVSVFWQAPTDTGRHQYVLVTKVGRN